MSVEISVDRLKQYLDKLDSAASSGAEFVVEQAPLFVQEYLAWEFWSHAMLAMLCLAVAAMLFVGTVWFVKAFDKLEELSVFGAVACGLFAVATMCGCGSHAYSAVKVKVAPRVVLVERVAEMAKGK